MEALAGGGGKVGEAIRIGQMILSINPCRSSIVYITTTLINFLELGR